MLAEYPYIQDSIPLIWFEGGLTAKEIVIGVTLLTLPNEGGWTRVGLRELSEATSIGIPALITSIQSMVEKGVVTKVSSPNHLGGKGVNTYYVADKYRGEHKKNFFCESDYKDLGIPLPDAAKKIGKKVRVIPANPHRFGKPRRKRNPDGTFASLKDV